MKVTEKELSADDIKSIKDAIKERRPVHFSCYTLLRRNQKKLRLRSTLRLKKFFRFEEPVFFLQKKINYKL